MNRIIGYENEKREVLQLKKMLLAADEYERRGLHIPRGLLISGECGVGKSVLARSMEGDGVHLTAIDFTGVEDSRVSEALRSAFEEAKKNAPSVLLLDELDKNAGESTFYFPRNMEKVRNALLRELDSIMSDDHILVVATCNDEDSLGEALQRSGRFDRHLTMALPDTTTRKLIAQSYLDDIDMGKEINLEELGSLTAGFSGADLECLVNEMGIAALISESPAITMDHFRLALNRKEFGGDARVIHDTEEKHCIAVHEAGHAIAALYVDPKSLHGASIRPQGDSRGHVEYAPGREKIVTVQSIENETTVLLAGHVAERLVLGTYTSGAENDIAAAVRKAHHLVSGLAAYGYENALTWVHGIPVELVSESHRKKMGDMVAQKLDEFDSRAAEIIEGHRTVFGEIVSALEAKDELTREELFEIKEQGERS